MPSVRLSQNKHNWLYSKKVMNEPILTLKQQLFIEYYVRGETGTKAAKLAYKTTSDNVAAVIASENLRKPKVAEVIKSLTYDSYNLIHISIVALSKALKAKKYDTYSKTYVDDIKTQMKASDKFLKIMGIYK